MDAKRKQGQVPVTIPIDTGPTLPDRKWTIDDIGRAFTNHAEREKYALTSLQEQITDLHTLVEQVNKVMIVGNGEPSVREQTRSNTRWIEGANRLVWAIVLAFVGQTIVFGGALLILVIILLYQHGFTI